MDSPAFPRDSLVHEQIGNGVMPRLGLGDRYRSNWEPVPLGEVGEVRLVFLDEEIVRAPDRRNQREGESAGDGKGNVLFAALCDLLGPEPLGLGERFAGE